jgi:hypothetical protein
MKQNILYSLCKILSTLRYRHPCSHFMYHILYKLHIAHRYISSTCITCMPCSASITHGLSLFLTSPSPKHPPSPLPQLQALLSVTASAKVGPQATCLTTSVLSDCSGTGDGKNCLCVSGTPALQLVPMPKRPSWPCPQAYRPAAVVSAKLWFCPATTCSSSESN